jgi:hypothetical protein
LNRQHDAQSLERLVALTCGRHVAAKILRNAALGGETQALLAHIETNGLAWADQFPPPSIAAIEDGAARLDAAGYTCEPLHPLVQAALRCSGNAPGGIRAGLYAGCLEATAGRRAHGALAMMNALSNGENRAFHLIRSHPTGKPFVAASCTAIPDDPASADACERWLREESLRGSTFYHLNVLRPDAYVARASVAHIDHISCVALDFDPAGNGDYYAERAELEERARQLVRLSGVLPAAVVSTGGGVQIMYRINPARTDAAMHTVDKMMKALARDIGADPSVTDRARVLRLAGTPNFPSDSKRRRGRDLSIAVPLAGCPTDPSVEHHVTDLIVKLRTAASALGLLHTGVSGTATRHASPPAQVGGQAGNRPRLAPDGEVQVRRWMKCIRNEGIFFNDRDSWVALIHALYGASGGAPWGREIACEFSDRWECGGDPAAAGALWDGIDPKAVKSGWGNLQALSFQGDPDGAAAALAAEARAAFANHPLDPQAVRAAATPRFIRVFNEEYVLIEGLHGVHRIAIKPPGHHADGDWGAGDRLIAAQQPQAFKQFYDAEKVQVGVRRNGDPLLKGKGSAWIDDPRARRLKPQAGHPAIGLWPVGQAPPGSLNLWSGLSVVPRPGAWGEIRTFLRDVICSGNAALFDWLVNWIAWGFQNPTVKGEVNVVLIGSQGTGKGTFADLLMATFGRSHSVHVQSKDQLLGNFNGHLEGAVFVFADEALFGHDASIRGPFKALTTEKTLLINEKFMPARRSVNASKILIASNELAAVPVEVGDRRNTVIEVSDSRKQDTAYFAALRHAMQAGELAAFVHYCLSLGLSAFDHRQPFSTAAKATVTRALANPAQRWWLEVLEAGALPGLSESQVRRGQPVVDDAWQRGNVTVFNDELYSAFSDWARRERVRHTPSREEFGRAIQMLCPDRRRVQPRGAAKDALGPGKGPQPQRPGCEFPPLDDCRTAADRALGH